MRIGFTGTRKGMTKSQQLQLMKVLGWWIDEPVREFHHGDGSDEHYGNDSSDRQAAAIAKQLGWDVKPHPPKDYTAAAMLERNRIVEANAQVLVAAPERDKEEQRSGTWMTVRCAQASEKPVVMLSRGKR